MCALVVHGLLNKKYCYDRIIICVGFFSKFNGLSFGASYLQLIVAQVVSLGCCNDWKTDHVDLEVLQCVPFFGPMILEILEHTHSEDLRS